MELLVIRHAIAEDRDAWAQTGEPDEKRPLTDEGQKRMRRAARGLQRIVKQIDVLATSPLTRAVQTAEIVGRVYGDVAAVVTEELIPEREPSSLLEWLKRLDDVDTVAVVGHEPHLSGLVCWLLTRREESFLELKKGGAVLLEFAQDRAAGKAKLLWALTPKQLRRLA